MSSRGWEDRDYREVDRKRWERGRNGIVNSRVVQ